MLARLNARIDPPIWRNSFFGVLLFRARQISLLPSHHLGRCAFPVTSMFLVRAKGLHSYLMSGGAYIANRTASATTKLLAPRVRSCTDAATVLNAKLPKETQAPPRVVWSITMVEVPPSCVTT